MSVALLITAFSYDTKSEVVTFDAEGKKKDLPEGIKSIKGAPKGSVRVSFKYDIMEEVETLLQAVHWAKHPDGVTVVAKDQDYLDFLFDSDENPAFAGDDDDPEEPAEETEVDDSNVEVEVEEEEEETVSRHDELAGKSLVNLRKLAKPLGIKTSGLRKEALVEAIEAAEEVDASPVPAKKAAKKPKKTAAKPKASVKAKKTAGAGEMTYKELQTAASELGHKVVGVKKDALLAIVAAGEPAEETAAPPKKKKAAPKKIAAKAKTPAKKAKPAVPLTKAQKKAEKKAEKKKAKAAAKRAAAKGPSKKDIKAAEAEAIGPIVKKIRPMVADLLKALGGSNHKTRIALSALVSDVDPTEDRIRGVIGYPTGQTLKVTRTHRAWGECSYTIKFNKDGTLTLVGFTGTEGDRTLEYKGGLKKAAKKNVRFKNCNAFFRMITNRDYPRLPLHKFFEGATVERIK